MTPKFSFKAVSRSLQLLLNGWVKDIHYILYTDNLIWRFTGLKPLQHLHGQI